MENFMSRINISGLTKRYGSNTIVDELDLTIEEGEFVVLLGPSGCGKTTTLRCLAGLETPEGGRIEFGDTVMRDAERRIDVPTHQRNIGMVFQSYALWPHMTVRDNIAYPLKVRKRKAQLRGGAVDKAAAMVDCGHLLDRYPAQLSGGQQQRIAVARGLVSEPDLVLFDEPLSNLDARLRDQVRTQIHQLHQSLHFKAVFVTHDQSEAFALGDRIAIMRGGKIEQIGTPTDVFDAPRTEYVADFIGMSNRLDLSRRESGWVTAAGDAVHVTSIPAELAGLEALTARLRPDDVRLYPQRPASDTADVLCAGTLVASEFVGRYYSVVVSVGGQPIRLNASAAEHGAWLAGRPVGAEVHVGFSPADARLYPVGGDVA
jgi:iron(III) transport system ATP-binding protein